MNYLIYSIFDRCTSLFGDPFTGVNDEDCKRKVAYAMRENPYKQDLVIYRVGYFCPEDGVVTPVDCGMPIMVCNLLECYEVNDNE